MLNKKILSIVLVVAIGAGLWFWQSSGANFTKKKMVHSKSFTTYTTEQTQDAISRKILLIDIRRLDEWIRYGTIKNSIKLTFFDGKGRFDAPRWLKAFAQIIPDKNQEFVLVCAHANRTKAVGEFLESVGYKNIRDLEGGINYGWLDKGLKSVPYR